MPDSSPAVSETDGNIQTVEEAPSERLPTLGPLPSVTVPMGGGPPRTFPFRERSDDPLNPWIFMGRQSTSLWN